MSKRIYDLATEVADYPVRQGKPDRTLLLCSHPRSGSTLLGESLYASGVFGCPIEYFHRGFRPAFVKRWQATDALSLRNAAHRYRTDSSGLFSTKLFWQDIEDIATELEPSLAGKLRGSVPANVYHHVFNLLEEWFPNPTFIYLTRKDICRQAISEVIANQTQQWRLIHGQGAQTEMPEIAYDYNHILRLIATINHCNQHWKEFFAVNHIEPYTLNYEELITEKSTKLRALFDTLGYHGNLPAWRMQRQATSQSEQLLVRFLRDYHAAAIQRT